MLADEPDGRAGVEQGRRIAVEVPHRDLRAADQLPAARRLPRVDAAELPRQAHRPGRHLGPRTRPAAAPAAAGRPRPGRRIPARTRRTPPATASPCAPPPPRPPRARSAGRPRPGPVRRTSPGSRSSLGIVFESSSLSAPRTSGPPAGSAARAQRRARPSTPGRATRRTVRAPGTTSSTRSARGPERTRRRRPRPRPRRRPRRAGRGRRTAGRSASVMRRPRP